VLQSAASRYAQVRNVTATPGEILLALYDGLFRFLNGAKACFEKKQIVRAREFLSKALAIVSELLITLKHPVAPLLCARLEGIYGFCMDRILMASRKADTTLIDEAIHVLTPLRDAWRIAVPKAAQELRAASAQSKA
jgi:flagellar protein FliS